MTRASDLSDGNNAVTSALVTMGSNMLNLAGGNEPNVSNESEESLNFMDNCDTAAMLAQVAQFSAEEMLNSERSDSNQITPTASVAPDLVSVLTRSGQGHSVGSDLVSALQKVAESTVLGEIRNRPSEPTTSQGE